MHSQSVYHYVFQVDSITDEVQQVLQSIAEGNSQVSLCLVPGFVYRGNVSYMRVVLHAQLCGSHYVPADQLAHHLGLLLCWPVCKCQNTLFILQRSCLFWLHIRCTCLTSGQSVVAGCLQADC